MPTSAMVALATITLGSAQATVTFSSISGAYRDLRLVVNATNSASTTGLRARFNGDTGANYSYVLIDGDGATAASVAATGQTLLSMGSNSTNDNMQVIDVLDYSLTDKHKTALIRSSGASNSVGAFAARWANTAAITTMLVFPAANSFSAGSTFTLYGIVS